MLAIALIDGPYASGQFGVWHKHALYFDSRLWSIVFVITSNTRSSSLKELVLLLESLEVNGCLRLVKELDASRVL